MRFKKFTFFFSLVLILMFPFFLKAQVPPTFETPTTITEEEVRQFLNEYMAQYMKRDLNAFMAFFAKEAVENQMLPYSDIREIYRKTFDNSDSLLYYLEIYSVKTSMQSATVSGRYEVIQILKGRDMKKIFRGNIQWDLSREDDSLKIRKINYGRDR